MYSQLKKNKTPDVHPLISKGQFSNDQKFYQELTQKLWESHPTDENLETSVEVPQMQTKRAQPYLTEENNLTLENRKLKETIIQMKLEMKSKLEADLLKQKNEFQTILQEYVAFIDKILQDKKDLQLQLAQCQRQEAQENQNELIEQLHFLQEENYKSLQQSEEFSNKLVQIETLLINLEEEKKSAYDKIEQLKLQNQQLKQHYEEKLQNLKQQHFADITKFESIVEEALNKKDCKIQRLKEQLSYYTDQF
ncbi:unnamed protein product (macronuclear) [Paramecium tetraurelia]|uniref:Uncharacterized protein n=1 Tax=Paramecium tetraurelia TaxID=5888 RepID=A0D785_PARTE|nr:uncharacterized protein GSPATT00001944001 [Paramecium tetraurelia]CAK78902.1 unnamed protein product [Paramecium tetraurelia]|eukprot:XP_001446299.1 hypothetical protein (macronuclear) [Paramecium tetraurelia strain d4-2]